METLCANHPIKVATGRCKRCNKPLCNECKMVTDNGTFCSTECFEAVSEFQKKVKPYNPEIKKSSLFSKNSIKGIIVLIVLLVVLFGFMKFQYGISSFGDIIDIFSDWFSYFLKIF